MRKSMIQMPIVKEIPQLAGLGNVVPEKYDYYEKVVTPNEDLALSNAYLKWYDIYPADAEITPEQVTETRVFLEEEARQGRLKLEGELGFVILHRAGSVLLLLLTIWRNTNEMWEAVYVKDLTEEGSYQQIIFDNIPRATYCVWELGPVWHERNAWVRFLASKRDDAAKLAYVNDRFEGSV